MPFPILTSLIALPIAGAILLLFVRDDEHNEALSRKIALVVSVLVFAETLLLWSRFNASSADFQFIERAAWIPDFGSRYFVGVDGISLLLLVLTGFLTPLALLGSWESIHKHTRAFCMFVLVLESAMMGVFVSLDLFLFYVFWDAMLIPMYFLIGIWGYDRRIYAAVKFMLYTMAGSVLMLIGIVYGALVAMVQPDLKKLVAYSSVSHLGFVVLGIAAMNTQGVQGAVYQMLSHGVSTGGLFLIVGMLSDRRHTRLIAEYGGLKKVMPHLVAVFLIVTLASIGLPGLNGFVGEFLILLGAFRWNPRMAVFAATGVVLSATYMLWMFQRVNYGEVTDENNARLVDLTPREWAVIVPVVAISVLMGVLPNLFLRPIEPSVQRMVNQVQQAAPVRIQAGGRRTRNLQLGIKNSELVPK